MRRLCPDVINGLLQLNNNHAEKISGIDTLLEIRFFLPTEHGLVGRTKQPSDVWSDIGSIGHAGGNERTGYPTQKPLAL